jgi:hypothetical protein
MPFAIHIINDRPDPDELWGPYNTEQLANEVKTAFVGVPESATVIPVTERTRFTSRPE